MEFTHCPYCKGYLVGSTRSFCSNCHEAFEDVDDRWFSTNMPDQMDGDSNMFHF